MRALPPAMAEALAQGVTRLARCWRLTRRDGVIVAATEHDRDLLVNGTLFKTAAALDTGDLETAAGLAGDRASVSGALRIDAISEDALALGLWTGATVELLVADWAEPSVFLALWRGEITGATRRGGAFQLDLAGPEHALARTIGRTVQRACDAALGDARCGVDLAAPGLRAEVTVLSASSDLVVAVASPGSLDPDSLRDGMARVMTGRAAGWAGRIDRVRAVAGGHALHLDPPCPVPLAAGDSIVLTPGCDKRFATCRDRFANALNFRGCPLMPGEGAALSGPAADGNTGASRGIAP